MTGTAVWLDDFGRPASAAQVFLDGATNPQNRRILVGDDPAPLRTDGRSTLPARTNNAA